MGAQIYAQQQAQGAPAGDAAGQQAQTPPEDEVVDAEIVDDEKPKGGAA
jgi:molecular chaperone DnaK